MSITSQNDFPLDPNSIDGTELCARINRWHADVNSGNTFGTRPPYVTAGGTWVRDNGAAATPRYELMIYNGTTDIKAGGSSFDAGTKITFNQTAAPTGWTKITTTDNAALRVVSGAVGSGGTVAFTTAFASHTTTGTVASHTLSVGEIPSHHHSMDWSSSDPGSAADSRYLARITGLNSTSMGKDTNNTGGGGGHTHGFTGGAIDLAVKYVDVIICSKD